MKSIVFTFAGGARSLNLSNSVAIILYEEPYGNRILTAEKRQGRIARTALEVKAEKDLAYKDRLLWKWNCARVY